MTEAYEIVISYIFSKTEIVILRKGKLVCSQKYIRGWMCTRSELEGEKM